MGLGGRSRQARLVAFLCGFLGFIGAPNSAFGASPGDLDPTFDYGGPSFSAREALFPGNGRILLVGQGYCRSPAYSEKLMAVRLQPDGDLDRSFARDGIFCERSPNYTITAFSDAALDRRGRLLLAGKRVLDGNRSVDSLLLRLGRRGRLDDRFSGNGKRYFDFGDSERAASILRDGAGRYLVAINAEVYEPRRERFSILRLHADGRLDSSFGGDGVRAAPHWVDDMYRLPSGKILVWSNPPFRMSPRASLDRSYGSNGFGDDLPDNLLGGDSAITPGGGLVWVGETWNSPGIKIAVVRWLRDGRLSESFGENGVVRTQLGTTNPEYPQEAPRAAAGGIAVQADGKLVVTGDAHYYQHPDCPSMQTAWRPVILRYGLDGELDGDFGTGGVVHPPGCSLGRANEVRGIAVQPRTQKIIAQAAGSIVRLLP